MKYEVKPRLKTIDVVWYFHAFLKKIVYIFQKKIVSLIYIPKTSEKSLYKSNGSRLK